MHGLHFHVANQTANIWGWKEWTNWKKLLYILIFWWFLSFAFAGVCCRELQHHSHSPKFEADATSTETSTHRDVHDLQTFCVPPWRLSPSGAHRIATVDASTLSSRYTFDTVTDKTETVQITDWSREAPRMSWSVFLERPDLELKINASPHRPKFLNQSLISLPRVDALQVVPSMHRRGWPGWIVTGAVQRRVVAVTLVGSHWSHKPCIEMLQLNQATEPSVSLSLAFCFKKASSGLQAGPVGNLFVSPISCKLRKTCTELTETHNQTNWSEKGQKWRAFCDDIPVSRHQGQISPLTLTARD